MLKYFSLLVFICASSLAQNYPLDYLDGKKLMNLNNADTSKFYYYPLDSLRGTFIKLKQGKIINYQFKNLPNDSIVEIDTIYYENGLRIFQKNKLGVKINSNLSIRKKASFSIIIHHEKNPKGNRYYYWKDGKVCSIDEYNPYTFTTKVTHYSRKGYKDWDGIMDKHGSRIRYFTFDKNGNYKLRLRTENGYYIQEIWNGKGFAKEIDTLSTNYIPVRQMVSFYSKDLVKLRLPFNNGLLQGDLLEYYPNGVLKKKVRFVKGQKDGEYFYYNRKGKLKKQGINIPKPTK